MTLAKPYQPTSELVAVAWLAARVSALSGGNVGTSLPSDVDGWAASGFVQVSALPAGVPDLYLPVRHPVLQIDAYATASPSKTSSSNKPRWNLAAQLIEAVRVATEAAQLGHYGETLSVKTDYRNARVLAAYLVTEPVKVLDDPSGYARFSADLALHWAPV